MPKATVTSETIKKELKTLEGGFVVLKRLPYGDRLQQQEMLGKLNIETERLKGQRKAENIKARMDMMNKEATLYEYAICIVDHNLEAEDGRKLDFKQPADVDSLRADIGEEITGYLYEINNFEDGLGN